MARRALRNGRKGTHLQCIIHGASVLERLLDTEPDGQCDSRGNSVLGRGHPRPFMPKKSKSRGMIGPGNTIGGLRPDLQRRCL
jgi:hypothetical protein